MLDPEIIVVPCPWHFMKSFPSSVSNWRLSFTHFVFIVPSFILPKKYEENEEFECSFKEYNFTFNFKYLKLIELAEYMWEVRE